MTEFCTNKAFVFLPQYAEVIRWMQAAHDLQDCFWDDLHPVYFMLSVILICHHLPFLFPTCPQSSIFLHSFHPLLGEWVTAIIIPHALKWHHTQINWQTHWSPPSSATPCPRPPQTNLSFLEMSCSSISDCHVTFCQSRENWGKKSNEHDDFSPLESEPVVYNLLWHSTSSASLFNNFVHRRHEKASRPVSVWWQVPIQTRNINSSQSKAQAHKIIIPALKSTW